VIDGYHFDPEYQKAARDASARVLVIDDTAHWPEYHADILLNQNLGADKLRYKRDLDTKLLLGTCYVMLRAEFERWRGWRRELPEVATKVLVTMGGSDPQNLTAKAVLALRRANPTGMEVRVLLGPEYQHERELRSAVGRRHFGITLVRRATDVAEHLAWADLAIAAGGSTCWEMTYMGLPAVTVAAAENQRQAARLLSRRGIVAYLGEAEGLAVADMTAAVAELAHDHARRVRMSHEGRGLVDGLGARRVAEKLYGRQSGARG
jgi:spore coat polysaccharide biosynthesis predicted glycosyltransferase SpsG